MGSLRKTPTQFLPDDRLLSSNQIAPLSASTNQVQLGYSRAVIIRVTYQLFEMTMMHATVRHVWFGYSEVVNVVKWWYAFMYYLSRLASRLVAYYVDVCCYGRCLLVHCILGDSSLEIMENSMQYIGYVDVNSYCSCIRACWGVLQGSFNRILPCLLISLGN